VLEAWLEAGIRWVQLRAKDRPSGEFLAVADRLSRRARRARAIFIVNDRVDVALLSKASGAHVGQTDLPPLEARRLLGPRALLGVSTHRGAEADAACGQPVDYIAVGPVFDTATKPTNRKTLGLAGVAKAARIVRRRRPLVAIGGITLDAGPAVLSAGADAVAVIGDLLTGDIGQRARDWVRVTAVRSLARERG
jgi:thiamine-phosphate pyrophosphorylase